MPYSSRLRASKRRSEILPFSEKLAKNLNAYRKITRMDAIIERRKFDLFMECVDADVDLVCDACNAAANMSAPGQQLRAVKSIGEFLEDPKDYVTDSMAELGLVPILLACLRTHWNFELQYEAIKALTMFACCDKRHCNDVIESGALPLLMQLLCSPALKVCDMVVLGLGNIIGYNESLRDVLLGLGLLQSLLSFIRNDTPPTLLCNVVFTLSNVCRCQESNLPIEAILMIVPYLRVLLYHWKPEILSDTLIAIRHLIDDVDDNIKFVVDNDLVPQMVNLLGHAKYKVYYEGLRALGHVVCGNIDQTNVVLNCGILAYLHTFLMHPDVDVREEACLMASNIAAGNAQQIQGLIDYGLIGLCVHNLRIGPFCVQKRVAWTIANITVGGHPEQVYTVLRYGAVTPLCDLLDCTETKLLKSVLSTVKGLISLTIKYGHANELAMLFFNCGAIEKIRQLQHHNNHGVSKRAREIIMKYVDA